MRQMFVGGVGILSLLGLILNVQGQSAEDAIAVIKKGIEAQGGAKSLEKGMNAKVKAKGTMTIGGMDVPFTMELVEKQPDKARTVLKLNVQGQDVTVVQILNGNKAWIQVAGQTKDATAAELADLKTGLYASRVSALAPLLADKTFTLKSLGESKVEGKAVLGVKVVAEGRKDIQLYFDKASGLLTKITRPGRDPVTQLATTQEQIMSDYKDYEGVKLPSKTRINNNGVRFMEANMTEVAFPAAADAKWFAKPE